MAGGTQAVLRDQVAVVTGGSRGIGAAIAQRLAELGAMVYLAGRSQKAVDAAANKIRMAGGNCVGYQADVCKWRDVEELAEFVNKESRRCDILVHSAGIGCFGQPLHEMDLQDWEDVMNTNLRGAFYCVKAFAPLMIRAQYGHIINISSIASKNPLPKGAAYAASKWGLNGLSYSIAEELRNYNIRVSLICPGSTDTGWSHYAGKDPEKMLRPGDISRIVELLVTQAPESFVSEIIVRPTRKP
ncbi:MAG: SDR family oxidoreductase [Terriglobia bacterium]|jgi:3-oxoacyl-[acyl-carrier protein] reductase|nr:SDR family oxidoreductase [Terriglobia bacterium]